MARFTVFGAGAVGGFFGWKLAGIHDVNVIARGSSAAYIRSNGLVIESGNHEYAFNPAVYESAAASPEPDFCLIAVKNMGLSEVIEALRSTGWRDTVFISLLNGIEANSELAHAFGPERTVAAFCMLGAELVAPGRVLHRSGGKIFFGQNAGFNATTFAQTVDLFTGAGIETAVPADFSRALWLKFVWNAIFNVLAARYNCTTDEILADRDKKAHAYALFEELLAAATLEKVDLRTSDRDSVVDGTVKWGAFIPSTLQDLRKGRPLETDAFCGAMLRLAKKHGTEFPAFETLNGWFETSGLVYGVR